MAKFCEYCGSKIPDDAAFCTECGAKVEQPAAPKKEEVPPVKEETPVPAPKPDEQAAPAISAAPAASAAPVTPAAPASAPEPVKPQAQANPRPVQPKAPVNSNAAAHIAAVYAAPADLNRGPALKLPTDDNSDTIYKPISQPSPAPSAPTPVETYPKQQQYYNHDNFAAQEAAAGSKPVSFGGFFGLMFLFAIPVLGFLASLIMSFAPKNKSLKNFARAHLVWTLIGLILSAIIGVSLFLYFRSMIGDIQNAIQQGMNSMDPKELEGLLGALTEGGIITIKP